MRDPDRKRAPEVTRKALIELVKVRGFAYMDHKAERRFRASLTPEEKRRLEE